MSAERLANVDKSDGVRIQQRVVRSEVDEFNIYAGFCGRRRMWPSHESMLEATRSSYLYTVTSHGRAPKYWTFGNTLIELGSWC